MKPSKVYEILEKDPTRKFKIIKASELINIPENAIIYVDSYGTIRNNYNGNATTININSELELIKEKTQVTFKEAIEARKNGKEISCLLNNKERKYKPNIKGISMTYNEDAIFYGQWFVYK